MFASGSIVGVLLLLGGLFLAQPAAAVEAICPGGSSPRSDIKFCVDFENLAGCTTGLEDACWTNNGYSSRPTLLPSPNADHSWKVLGGGGAVGLGYGSLRPVVGGVGDGNVVQEPVPGWPLSAGASPTLEIALRYYVRFKRGWVSFYSGHGAGFCSNKWTGTRWDLTTFPGCLRMQMSTFTGLSYYSGSLGADSITMYPNVAPNNGFLASPILNNRWYLIEIYSKIDTACTNTADPHGCNGIFKLWVDGVLVTQHTDLNMGGVINPGGVQWTRLMAWPGLHFHYGIPPWDPEVDFDNLVASNCRAGACVGAGPFIGPATGENARGTGDALSPYIASGYTYTTWLGRLAGGDCTSGGALGPYDTVLYRSGGVLDPTITHGLYVTQQPCETTIAGLFAQTTGQITTVTDGTTSTDCTVGGGAIRHNCTWTGTAWVSTTATDNSLKVNLTNNTDGGGTYWPGGPTVALFARQWASYGWVYLPSSSFDHGAPTNLVLAGFTNTVSGTPTSGYVGITRDGSGNWAVNQVDASNNKSVISTGTPFTLDTWHEYELIVWNDQTVSLMVDRVRLLNRTALPRSVSWLFGGAGASINSPIAVVGVIDFQGTQPFTAYFDDNTVTTASAWSCDGWGNASCPFGGGMGSAPIAPTNLTVR